MTNQQEHDTCIIPPNFIDTGTFFGGLFKARNVIEAGIVSAAIGLPIIFCLPYSLTARIVILCLTVLPLALAALIGIDGESLSAFLLDFLRFCHRRRIVGGTEEERDAAERRYHPIRHWLRKHLHKRPEANPADADIDNSEDIPPLSELESGEAVEDETEHWRDRLAGLLRKGQFDPSLDYMNPVSGYLPIQKIENGIVHTKDGRYLKIVEVEPINFLLRSAAEQRGIVYSFLSWLKISPVKLQFKVPTRRAESTEKPLAEKVREVTAPTLTAMEWKTDEVKKLLLSQDMRASPCRFWQEQALLSSLPLAGMDRGLARRSRRNLLSGGAASCYPFVSYEMCDDNGILLGVNKYNRSLIIIDLFNAAVYKNANMAILGTSGAGKTFTMQLMALRMRRKGIPVFIIAPLKGHEFHRACINMEGSFIQISPASPHCINVMEIRRVDRSVSELLDGPDTQLSELTEKIQRLHIFFSLLIPDMSHGERQLLDEALIRAYAAKGITHDNASLIDPANSDRYREMPVLGDLYTILKEGEGTRRLANILNRFVHGSASTFNQQTNVSLDNKYTVLDISSLTGELLTVGMFVALDFVWDRAKADRTEEKAIFIDECWQLLSGAGETGTRLAGDFILEIFKTIRGYGGAAVCASQDLNDFFGLDGGRFGKGIINNSKTKIILNLEEDEAARVQSILHLSDAELLEVTHFERGSGLISTNHNNIMVEFKASPLEKELITTDRRELKVLVERKRAGQEYVRPM